jgi:hypothetical protein
MEKIFHNYDVSFHNELWASAFSGKWAAGTTWHWERVFWWPDALPVPPPDDLNLLQPNGVFSNLLGQPNHLDIGTALNPIEVVVPNKRIHYHFKPLADLLNHPEVRNMGVLSGGFTPQMRFDGVANNPNPIECYYLKSASGIAAIGWIHNRHAVVAKSYCVKKGPGNHNMLGCVTPSVDQISLPGFQAGQDYYVYWFPTRLNTTPDDIPEDYAIVESNGTIVLDFSTHAFNGVLNNYLDTLRSDYAFVISPQPIVKSLIHHDKQVESAPLKVVWDFAVFPNPARDGAWLRFDDEVPKDIEVFDALGRRVVQEGRVTEMMFRLNLALAAKGLYWVRVSDGMRTGAKPLLIH